MISHVAVPLLLQLTVKVASVCIVLEICQGMGVAVVECCVI